MLLSGERDAMQGQLASIIKGYEDFCEFEDNELQLIEALRTLRLLHYSGWIARRWNDPAFPAAFPWFGAAGYWGMLIEPKYGGQGAPFQRFTTFLTQVAMQDHIDFLATMCYSGGSAITGELV